MTTDRDDAQVRRYRRASAALDERPSAATRAAILAAAARHVEARPQPAGAPRPAHRRRWPLAAAAAVLLSTLAVMLATRTEQELPRFTAPAERAAEPAPAAPAASAPAAPAASAPPIAVTPPRSGSSEGPRPAPTIGKPTAPDRAAATPPRAAKERQSANEERAAPPAEALERRDAASDVAPEVRGAPAAPARSSEAAGVDAQRAAPAAPPAPAPSTPPPAAKRTLPPAVGSLGAGEAGNASDATKPEAARSAERAMRREAAPAAQALPAPEPASAQEWLEQIVRLRGAGRHDEAEAELKRFRERYPEVQVPAAALPPGPGTR